jgi:hypothetical protein
MPIFKYTVANKEGKKLSGTVEAPDEKTARSELNNLGFSILTLKETNEVPEIKDNLTLFVFEAVDKNSKLVSGTIPEENEEEAFKKLKDQYALTVTAIWKKDATEEEIKAAKKKGTEKLREQLLKEDEYKEQESFKQQKEEQFTKAKIETILKDVNEILIKFDKEIDLDQKSEINKRINKLLRIKQSKNLGYILQTAEELLKFIETQEKYLKTKGHEEKRLELQIKTKKLLDELNKKSGPKTISEDILTKIDNWERSHEGREEDKKTTTIIIANLLSKIKNFFKTPPQIKAIQDQIKVYNRQIWEFIKLYFKEPTPEYKEKVKNSIKTIYKARKKAIHSLQQAKKLLKIRKKEEVIKEHLILSFIEELNALTGWLLAFYIIYYIVALYITTKDFGLETIPPAFYVYESHLFKYALAILFLMHATTSIKINFLKKSFIANLILPPVFIFGSIIILLNF